MGTRAVSFRPGIILTLAASLVTLAACGAATAVVVSPTHTPPHAVATATPSGPPPHAFAWTQVDGSGAPQIWASLSGATPVQITHYTLPAIICNTYFLWSPPVFSPDLTHIVAAIGGAQCGDGPWYGPVSIITTATGAIASVPGDISLLGIRLNQRAAGWVDNNTIFFVNGSGAYTYTLGAAAATKLPGIASAEEAVMRGTTLYYANITYNPPTAGLGPTNSEAIHRYDMTSHTVLPGSISLGSYSTCSCSPGDYPTLGWDVSADGGHIVYQSATPGASSGGFSIGFSHIWYGNADGTSASSIAQALTGSSFLRLSLSPNGALVAITQTDPAGPPATASVTTPGLPGDPNFHTYAPNALEFPVWKWNSEEFWAATSFAKVLSPGSIYDYTLGTATAPVGVSGGYNPWYTIGS